MKAGTWVHISSQRLVQVQPTRIVFLYQTELPSLLPFLDRLLSCNGTFHGVMAFIPDQRMYAVTLRESLYQIVLVLPDSLDKIGGDSNIQCPVALTGKDVHARLLQAANFLDTGLRR